MNTIDDLYGTPDETWTNQLAVTTNRPACLIPGYNRDPAYLRVVTHVAARAVDTAHPVRTLADLARTVNYEFRREFRDVFDFDDPLSARFYRLPAASTAAKLVDMTALIEIPQ